MVNMVRLFLYLTICFISPFAILGTVIHVPSEQATIQEAIDAAQEGDTVLVSDGVYTGPGDRNLGIFYKSITLKSRNGPQVTKVGTEIGGRVIMVSQCDSPGVVIDGFTFFGGRTGVYGGGGLGAYESHLIVRNCVFYDNRAIEIPGLVMGGGALFDGSRAELHHCTFVKNECYSGSAIWSVNSQLYLYACLVAFNIGSTPICSSTPADTSLWPIIECSNVLDTNEYPEYCQCNYYNVISADPLFCDLALNDFSLKDNSVCLPENNVCGVLMGAIGEGCAATDVVDEEGISLFPKKFRLNQNKPNPFNLATTIGFTLLRKSDVSLIVYDLIGRKVVTLIDDSRPAGDYNVVWDGLNEAGLPVASGIYFYHLKTDDFRSSKKMVLMK